MVSKMTKLNKDTIRKSAEGLAAEIREYWVEFHNIPCLKQITTAASLAHHGMLGSVEKMCLSAARVDLASVPSEHLASLAACVTKSFIIRSDVNCDIFSILDNIKCEVFDITNQTLSSEETWALVQAMETRVGELVLCGAVFLDLTALTKYSGQGLCKEITCDDDGWMDMDIYVKELRGWAQRINWKFDAITQTFYSSALEDS